MAISLQQTIITKHVAGSSQNNPAYGSGTTAGNCLVIACIGNKIGGGQPSISTVADDKSQNWTLATLSKGSETTRFYTTEIWTFKNTAAGVSTVTVTWSAAQSDTDVWLFELAGCSTTAPQDGNGVVLSNQSTANPTIPTITTTNANDILIGVAVDQHGMTGGNANSYTLVSIDGTPNDYAGACSYRIVSATNTYTGDAYTASAGAWCASVAAFGDNAGGGGGGSAVNQVPSLPMLGMQ